MKTPWEEIYNRFDPEEPVPIDQPRWRVRRPYSPATQLAPDLSRPFGEKRFLIVGTVGAGKSTELHQLAEARSDSDFVIVVDLWRHFVEQVGDRAALDHVQPWEVVFLIGLHVYRAAQEKGHTWAPSLAKTLAQARQKFGKTPDAQVDVAKLAQAVSVLVGGTIGGTASAVGTGLGRIFGSGRWTLPIGRLGQTLDQDERVQGMLSAVNALIEDVQRHGRRVALFVDGLDRVREVETVRELLVESSLLGKLSCTTVLTGPILIRRAGLGGSIRSFETRVLANVPVIDPESLELTDLGRQFFRDAWARRASELDAVNAIPEALIDQLALRSGGRTREFVRMIRMVTMRSYDAQLEVATQAIIDDVIDTRRRLVELGLNQRHIELLKSVQADVPAHDPPDDPRIAEMLERFWLLPYPNESEWYYPHPLLLMVKLRGSDASDAR